LVRAITAKWRELRGKLSPFLDSFGEPTGAETYRDVLNLVLTAREIVLALDGFDPEFCVVPRPLVEIFYTNAKVRNVFASKTVVDAFEGKGYAIYIWDNNTKKKYWEVPPEKCSVTLLYGEGKVCHSADGPDGFDALVKQYME